MFHGTRIGKYYCKNMKYRINIYIYVCVYVYMYIFSMVRSRTRQPITLTVRLTAHFPWAGVALTNTWDSSIAHIPWKKLKRRREHEREFRQNELEIKKARLELKL